MPWCEFPDGPDGGIDTLEELGFPLLRVHPAALIERDGLSETMTVLALYDEWRGGGFGGGQAPEAGGSLHQPAALIAAFKIIARAQAALKDKSD